MASGDRNPRSMNVPPDEAEGAGRTSEPAGRLMSLDVLRGFDMFWIMGADSLGGALAAASGGTVLRHLAEQLEHVAWEGFRFYDLIFPLFVFLAGISLVYSLEGMMAREGRDAAFLRVVRRTILLYLLGLFYYGGFAGRLGPDGNGSGRLEDIRLLGVLQRIALCYGITGFAYVWFGRRVVVGLGVAALVGYWAAMMWVPVPGIGAGHLEEGKNLANWLDARYLPWRKWDGDHDPEGLLSTIPAVATCILGVMAGWVLRDPGLEPAGRSMRLAAMGAGCLVGGYLWSLHFPVIKKLWTSSYVLVAGGWSYLLMAAFHQVVDVWRWRGWAQPFLWIGSNAILVYLVSALVDFTRLAQRFTGGDVERWVDGAVGRGWGAVVVSLTGLGLVVLLARALHQRKVFVRL